MDGCMVAAVTYVFVSSRAHGSGGRAVGRRTVLVARQHHQTRAAPITAVIQDNTWPVHDRYGRLAACECERESCRELPAERASCTAAQLHSCAAVIEAGSSPRCWVNVRYTQTKHLCVLEAAAGAPP